MNRKSLVTIEVELGEIEVDEHYYSFDYVLWVNGKKKAESRYESDHAWGNNKRGLIKMLLGGEAAKLVIEEAL